MNHYLHSLIRLRTLFVSALILLVAGSTLANIKITAVKGDVAVRRGTSEIWTSVATGDILKPEDSMRLGKRSSATIITPDGHQLVVPELVLLDLADVRSLTQEELLLQLAMERVRAVPDRDRNNDLTIPRTTTVHGSNRGAGTTAVLPPEDGTLVLNGVHMLFHNGFYATGVLRAKELFRLMPSLSTNVESRMMVASALEKMNVNSEALSEYLDIAHGNLTTAQHAQIDQKIAMLKKKSRD